MLACVLLSELEGRGHSCLMLDELVGRPVRADGLERRSSGARWPAACGPLPKNVKAWIALLAGAGQVWQAGEFSFDQPLVLDGERLYLRRYWRDETLVASSIGARARQLREVDRRPGARAGSTSCSPRTAQADAPDWQKLACAIALRGSVAIITGGPGTGKTYTVARLLALLFALAPDAGGQRIALAAPTGKAAARLKQSIDKALTELADKVGDAAAAARADRPHGRRRAPCTACSARGPTPARSPTTTAIRSTSTC